MSVNNKRLESVMMGLDSFLSSFISGKIKDAFETSQAALKLSEQSGDIFSKAFAESIHGVSCYGKGLFNDAIKHLETGVDLTEKVKQHWWDQASHHFLGEVYFAIEDYSKSEEHFQKNIEKMEKYKYLPSWRHLNQMALERLMAINGEGSVDIERFFKYVSNNKVKQYEGWMSNYMSEILLHMKNESTEEAENWIKKAISINQKNVMMFQLGKDHLVYWKILKKKESQSESEEMLMRAVSIFKKCGADGWAEKYEKELSTLQ